MKATLIYVVLAMAISTLAATTPVQNDHRVQSGNNRFGGNGRGGQNGQQNKGSANKGNQNGNANNSNNKNAGAANANGANTGSVRTANGASGSANSQNNGSQNQANNSTASAGAAGAAGAASGSAGNSADAQTSTTLDPAVIATGFASNGQETPEAGQVASLTSTNNFINFCLTVPNLPITNGKQITTGSCNPAPMGIIPSTDNMPSAKFVFPTNGATIQENSEFTIKMAIANMQTGAFVNADANYFSAPQQTNAQGQIVGHSHVVVESLSALDQTTPTDPRKFAFFKGLNAAASGGILTADVANGLPAGFYKLSSINTAANHQPVLVPIAQHGSLDDAVYFTVSASGAAASNSTAAAGAASTGAAAAGAASTGAANAGAANTGAAAGAAGAGAAAGAAGAANNANQAANKGQANNQNQNQGNKAQNGSQRNANNNNKGGQQQQQQKQGQQQKNGQQGQNQRGRGRRFARQLQF